MAQAASHRQLLMRCHVTNAAGERSTRYVQHEVFPLWEYLVTSRHNLDVDHPVPCMWVPHDQWRRNDRLFVRSGKNERVVRMTFTTTSANNVTEQAIRFVPDRDFDVVNRVLVRHMQGSSAIESRGVMDTAHSCESHLSWDIESGGAILAA